MTIILGIDPALSKSGWGIVSFTNNNLSFIACGTIKTDAKDSLPSRVLQVSQGITAIIKKYQPDEVAIEETFLNKNPTSSLKLGHARGAIILTCSLQNIPIYEYAATLIKKTVVGKGRAEKQQVVAMLQYLLPGCKTNSFDEADALATAICHTNHFDINKLKAL